MKYTKFILIIGFGALSACSRFSPNSVVTSIQDEIDDILNSSSAVEIVSGGTQVVQTNPGTPSQNYKVTSTIGQFANQSTYTTTDGYKVQSVLISE